MAHALQDRAPQAPAAPDEARAVQRPTPPRRRPGRIVVAALGVAVLVPVALRGVDLLPEWGNPFAQEVVDRSTPPLLLALADLSEYHAATGTFQVVVDVERDTPFVPSFVSGERTTFLATGEVDALVDFTDLGPGRVQLSADGTSATIALPAPQLADATIDPGQSRVLDRDRGVVERVGSAFEDSPTGETGLYLLAETKIDAAAVESDLAGRAETNTRAMLTALATSLGVDDVTVTFGPPA